MKVILNGVFMNGDKDQNIVSGALGAIFGALATVGLFIGQEIIEAQHADIYENTACDLIVDYAYWHTENIMMPPEK